MAWHVLLWKCTLTASFEMQNTAECTTSLLERSSVRRFGSCLLWHLAFLPNLCHLVLCPNHKLTWFSDFSKDFLPYRQRSDRFTFLPLSNETLLAEMIRFSDWGENLSRALSMSKSRLPLHSEPHPHLILLVQWGRQFRIPSDRNKSKGSLLSPYSLSKMMISPLIAVSSPHPKVR